MFGIDIWDLLGIIALIILVSFTIQGKKDIWGWFFTGLLIALIFCLFYYFRDHHFNWLLARQILIVSTLLGFVYELSGILSGYNKGD